MVRIIPAGAGLTSRRVSLRPAAWDHPRGCGAHSDRLNTMSKHSGSSPRVRGSHDAGLHQMIGVGIIPAGAGLTSTRRPRCHGCRDHPRGCGAHLTLSWKSFVVSGSSPRVRGSRYVIISLWNRYGIIPAGAGLTRRRLDGLAEYRDHPRGCGAHGEPHPGHRAGLGSSPRVRGSLGGKAPFGYRFGIIPAGAGLTECGMGRSEQRRDHPRGCGAHGLAS